jgi:glycine/D-amino acid oxidase-like deaminating enzyme
MVVAAAGPWSPQLLRHLGAEVPLEVVRPEQAFLGPPADFGPPHPIVADLPNEVYYKPEGQWTRVGSIAYDDDDRVADPDTYDQAASPQFLHEARERLARRYPAYARSVIWGGGSGLYTVTPDAHACIGPLAGLTGFILVTGFSGHGFKLAPSVGRGVAEWVTGGRCRAFDLGFFDPGRFAVASRIATSYKYKILG